MKGLRNQIRRIIKEEMDASYSQEVRMRLYRTLGKKDLYGWELHVDPQVGSFNFIHPKYDYEIFATPFWEGNTRLSVEVYQDGDITKSAKELERLLTDKIKLYPTGRIDADVAAAKIALLKLFSRINKILN